MEIGHIPTHHHDQTVHISLLVRDAREHPRVLEADGSLQPRQRVVDPGGNAQFYFVQVLYANETAKHVEELGDSTWLLLLLLVLLLLHLFLLFLFLPHHYRSSCTLLLHNCLLVGQRDHLLEGGLLPLAVHGTVFGRGQKAIFEEFVAIQGLLGGANDDGIGPRVVLLDAEVVVSPHTQVPVLAAFCLGVGSVLDANNEDIGETKDNIRDKYRPSGDAILIIKAVHGSLDNDEHPATH
eukprot:Lithocolla_globosa_v1_NODE_2453_length_1998_cov_21.430777.p2 type:complete len:238 gc:universal NODE_2453_length_1998_cov_21.430777:1072-359(-)